MSDIRQRRDDDLVRIGLTWDEYDLTLAALTLQRDRHLKFSLLPTGPIGLSEPTVSIQDSHRSKADKLSVVIGVLKQYGDMKWKEQRL